MVENFNGEPKLPDGWSLKALPEELYFISGKAHEKHISDVGHYVVVNSKFISSDGRVRKYSTDNFQPARRGDILMVMSDLPNGKALAKTFLVDKDKLYAVNQRVCILRARAGFPEYFRYQLDRAKYFLSFDDGVQQTHLLNKVFEECPVIVPKSVEEQKAIATALKDIDDLIGTLDTLIAKKRDIKQAAMQQLLTGKTRLPGFATTPMTNSAIGNLPSDWEVRPLGSLGDPVIGLTYRPVDVRETGTLVLRSSNVQDGVLAFDNNVFVDPEVASRALVAKGDILICVRNGSRALIGKCAMISDEAEGMAFGAFMSVFRSPHSDFLFHQFQSNIIQRQIHEHLGATINQITNASLRSFQVPFPVSAEERGAIVTILSDMDAELTGLTVKLSKLNMVREGMMQQLLTGRIRLV